MSNKIIRNQFSKAQKFSQEYLFHAIKFPFDSGRKMNKIAVAIRYRLIIKSLRVRCGG
jgi:hypothetical protein